MRTDEQILKIVNAVLAGDKSVEDALPAVKADLEERIRQHAQSSAGYRPRAAACINKLMKEGSKVRNTEPAYFPFGDQYIFWGKQMLVGMNDDYHYPAAVKPPSEKSIRDNFYCYAENQDTDEPLTLDIGGLRAQEKILKAEHGKEPNFLEFGECKAVFRVDLVLRLCDILKVDTVKICSPQSGKGAWVFAENEAQEWGLLLGKRHEE